MTDATTNDEAPRRKKGKGERVAPSLVLNNSTMRKYFPPPPKKVGAPTTFTAEMGDRICAWIAEGKTLYSFCLQEGTPNIATVSDWRRTQPVFDKNYARARDDGWDVFAEKLIERSIDVRPEYAQSRRLEIDAGKWYLSKVAHRRYGDRLDVKQEITGPGGGPLQLEAVLLKPELLASLDEAEVLALRSAVAKLAAPVIEAVATPVAEAAASMSSGAHGAGVDASDGDDGEG